MKKMEICLIPGPVTVPKAVLEARSLQYSSPDLDKDFLALYNQCESGLQQILQTKNRIMIQTGEGMLGLWGALKSCLKPGDRVVAVCTGVFGYGIADMAESIGAKVKRFQLEYDRTVDGIDELDRIVDEFQPKMLVAVHCETPSGTLNPLDRIAEVKKKRGVKLFCVDSVASAGGMPVEVARHLIDLSLNGSQKCLSAPADMTFVSISETAWHIIEEVGYQGYDAFAPFRRAQETFYFPNTMSWHGVAGLNKAAELILAEGLSLVYQRHLDAMLYCHRRIQKMGLELFPAKNAVKAPSVTAVKIPAGFTWKSLDIACREKGLAIAGSYGPLSGKVFRIGHMGSQADIALLEAGLDILESII
jgi:aspartate aminotransferase-like enzyme